MYKKLLIETICFYCCLSLSAQNCNLSSGYIGKVNYQTVFTSVTSPLNCPIGDYVVVFEDDFNGNQINSDKWDTHFPWAPVNIAGDIAVALPDNVVVENGLLKFIIKNETVQSITSYNCPTCCMPWGCPSGITTPCSQTDFENCTLEDGLPNLRTYNFTSGMIYSKAKFKYGKFEIRCKLPPIDGIWPAYWLYGSCNEEIDVFEFLNYSYNESTSISSSKFLMTYHNSVPCTNARTSDGISHEESYAFNDAFHTFSVEWDPYKIIWALDGTVVREVYRFQVSASGQDVNVDCQNTQSGTYSSNQYLPNDEMNLTAGLGIQNWGLNQTVCTRGTYPMTMEVDYIRVWQRNRGCCPDHKLYENTNILPDVTHVSSYIKAGNDAGVSGVNGNVTVLSGQSVVFKAGDYIELLPGFSTEPGAHFEATIEDCNPLTKPEGDNIELKNFPNNFSPDGDGSDDQLCLNVDGATSYTIHVHQSGGLHNELYAAYDVPITSNPVCIWDGSCNFSGNCWSYVKCDKTREIHVTFKNCDNQLIHVLDIDVNCGSGKTNQTSQNNSDNNNSNDTIFPNQVISNKDIKPEFQKNQPEISNPHSAIIISPNPTTGRTVIYFSPEQISSATARLEITDVIGRKVFEKNPFGQGVANYIDLSHLQKGVYFLKISTEDEVRVEKVVVE